MPYKNLKSERLSDENLNNAMDSTVENIVKSIKVLSELFESHEEEIKLSYLTKFFTKLEKEVFQSRKEGSITRYAFPGCS